MLTKRSEQAQGPIPNYENAWLDGTRRLRYDVTGMMQRVTFLRLSDPQRFRGDVSIASTLVGQRPGA